jgi:polysaccharide export outer membrane protein
MKPVLSFRCLAAALLVGSSLGLTAQVARADNPATAAATPPPPKPGKALYSLTVQDRVHVAVVGEEDMATSQTIDGHGNVNLVFIGETHIAGLTVAEAQDVIAKAYVDQRYLKPHQVTISVEEYAPRRVSIQGAVKSPGSFQLPNEGTWSVVELVTKAGGFTDIGKGSDVRITHANGGKTEHIDVQGIITGKSSVKPDDDSLMLRPGDIVFVPEKLI